MQRTLILRLYQNNFTADITITKNRSQANNLKLQQESKGSVDEQNSGSPM